MKQSALGNLLRANGVRSLEEARHAAQKTSWLKKPTGAGRKRRTEAQLRKAAAKLSLPDSIPVTTEKAVLDQWAKDLTDSRDVSPMYRIMEFNNEQDSIIRGDLIQQRRLASSIEKGYKKASSTTKGVMRLNLITAY